MARQPRIEYPGALYHVISRGIERRDLYRDDEDRERYLVLLEKAIERFRFRLYAYCMMSNHVHLAMETGRVPLSRIMRSINTSYAGYFNWRHKRTGYLFQGRYKAFLVDKEEYFLSLVRYIHENPVKAGIARSPGDYRWSSHRSYLGKAVKWLASDEVLERFGRSRSVARKNFSAFFGEEERGPYETARRYVQTVVGQEGFARTVIEEKGGNELLLRSITPESLVAFVSKAEGVALESLRGRSRDRELSRVRAICGYLGRETAHLPLSKVARYLNRDQTTLLRGVGYLEGAMRQDRRLSTKVKRLAADLVAKSDNT